MHIFCKYKQFFCIITPEQHPCSFTIAIPAISNMDVPEMLCTFWPNLACAITKCQHVLHMVCKKQFAYYSKTCESFSTDNNYDEF